MLHRILAAVLVSLVCAAPGFAQGSIWDPPHAGTPVRCCTSWSITASRGWPAEFPDMTPVDGGNLSPHWPVVTIRAVPRPPSGNAYGLDVPGMAMALYLRDATAVEVRVGSTLFTLGPLGAVATRRFPTVATHALGGQFQGQGILAVVYAAHLPPSFKVTVVPTDRRQAQTETLTLADIR
jgi:hypothetical protein